MKEIPEEVKVHVIGYYYPIMDEALMMPSSDEEEDDDSLEDELDDMDPAG